VSTHVAGPAVLARAAPGRPRGLKVQPVLSNS
jgi:hypothetical protein